MRKMDKKIKKNDNKLSISEIERLTKVFNDHIDFINLDTGIKSSLSGEKEQNSLDLELSKHFIQL